MTQTERVLADLKAAGLAGVCSSHWYRSGIPNSRNRISTELRPRGHHIASAPCGDDHGRTTYARYVWFHGPERECPACPWKPAQLALLEAV